MSTANIGSIYLLLNIPLVFLGWMHVSRRFMLYTLYGISFFSATILIFRPNPLLIGDPILAALLAGVFCGTGGGIVLRSMGSAGGLDILSVYLNKKLGLRIGLISFVSNAIILIAGAFLYDVERALYSIIFLYTGGRVMDVVITGLKLPRNKLRGISDCQGIWLFYIRSLTPPQAVGNALAVQFILQWEKRDHSANHDKD